MGKLTALTPATIICFCVFLIGFVILLTARSRQSVLQLPQEEVMFATQGKITSDPSNNQGVVRFRIAKLQVVGYTEDELFYGDEVEASGILTPHGTLKQAEVSLVSHSVTMTTKLHDLNNRLAPTAGHFLPKREAAVINGMVLGLKPKGDFFFSNAMRKTGTIHILVVSGSNLTLVGGFLLGFRRLLGRRMTMVVTLSVIWFYALLTGGQAPVMRAAIMLTITFVAEVFGKQRWDFYALTLTAVIMLFSKPNLLTDISFQLSFGATLGLILFAKPIAKQFQKIHFGKWAFSRLPFGIADNLATTLAVQIVIDPLLLYYFHQFSAIAVFANLLVLPLVLYLTLGGAVLIILGSLLSTLGTIASLFLLIPVTYFTHMVVFLSQLPFASLTFEAVPLAFVMIYYIALSIVSSLHFLRSSQSTKQPKNDTIKR